MLSSAALQPSRKAADLSKDDEEQIMELVVNRESEALDLALEHSDEVIRDSEVFNAIVETFLWPYISFGCRGWPEGADVPSHKVDELLKSIPSTHLSDRDKKMVRDSSPFFIGEEANLCNAAVYFQAHL